VGGKRGERTRPLLDRPWKVRLVRWAMLAVVLAGSLSGPLALLSAARPAAAPGSAGEVIPPAPAGAAGFAELYVTTYLEQAGADRPEALKAFYPGELDLEAMTAGRLYVARAATVDVTWQGENYWRVTVAATLFEAVKGRSRPGGTQFYAVGVHQDGEGAWVATSLPAVVPAPATADPPELVHQGLDQVAPDDPLASTLQRFFEALLTGAGELDRYANPSSGVRAVTPPPFETVALRRLTQRPPETPGLSTLAMAEVVATSRTGLVMVLHYAIELKQNSDRWEVTHLNPNNPLTSNPTP
jgi:hypothetical protein